MRSTLSKMTTKDIEMIGDEEVSWIKEQVGIATRGELGPSTPTSGALTSTSR